MPTSSTAATHGGRLEIASICSFSMKMVSVLSQLWLRIVRSISSELPTRLQSGCVLVTSGVFFQCSSWTSSMRDERALRRRPIRKRMVGEGPGVALTPEAVHEGVHVLDERAAVELRGQERVQLAEGVLEERDGRSVAPGTFADGDRASTSPPRRAPSAPCRGRSRAGPAPRCRGRSSGRGSRPACRTASPSRGSSSSTGRDRGGPGASAARARWAGRRASGRAAAARRPRSPSPCRRRRKVLPPKSPGDVGDEAHAVAGHDRARGCRGHHDLGAGEHFLGRVLRKRSLVEAVVDRRRRAPVVAVPVVSRNEAQGGAGGGGPEARGAQLEKQPPVHSTSVRLERTPGARRDALAPGPRRERPAITAADPARRSPSRRLRSRSATKPISAHSQLPDRTLFRVVRSPQYRTARALAPAGSTTSSSRPSGRRRVPSRVTS